jgi:hypothetical protein
MPFPVDLSIMHWAVLSFAAVLAGLARAGLDGGTLLAIPLLAAMLGARNSSSIMLGILLTADLGAIWKYRTLASPGHLLRTLPAALIGIIIGALVGHVIPEQAFRMAMSAFILTSAVLLASREARGASFILPERWYIAAPLGLLAGFSSMVGNAGGPMMSLFLLSSGLLKNRLIGTMVWFFFITNVFKLPLHVFMWRTFSLSTLLLALVTAPLSIGAAFGGARLVRLIPERPYRMFRIAVSAIGGVYLLLA